MSRFVADQLTGPVLSRISFDAATDHADLAIVICSVDEHGWAHPAMLSSLEVVARDARNVRIAIHARSRSARNMQANGKLTLVLVDERSVYYVKGDVLLLSASLASSPDIAKFNLRVDSVLEDNPAEYERARIVSGIRVTRDAVDAAASGALLEELLAD